MVMQVGKYGPQGPQATVRRVGYGSLLQAASPLELEASMRQFSVNSTKVIECFMARSSSVPPFGSPPHPLHSSLILVGGKEFSTHFVTLFLITHLPLFPSVLSLTLIPFLHQRAVSFNPSRYLRHLFLFFSAGHRSHPLSAPDSPWPHYEPFSLSALPGAPWLQHCLATHPCGRNSFQQCLFLSLWLFTLWWQLSPESSRQRAR